MALRTMFGPQQVLKGAKISGCLSVTLQTAVLIETLKELGAELRWASCNNFSTHDHAAAALVHSKSANIFAWKGETKEEFWNCNQKIFEWPDCDGPDLLIDDGGDCTIFIHDGIKYEQEFAKTGAVPNPDVFENRDFEEMTRMIIKGLRECGDKWTKIGNKLIGIAEETTCGIHRLQKMSKRGELLVRAINVNDSVTKTKFDNMYGCRQSVIDGIMRATGIMISGKQVVICGYGDVGKGCAQIMRAYGARVVVTECDPICALQACMEGHEVKRLETVVREADIFITATGNRKVITTHHMEQMKNNVILGNIGSFDNEIDVDGLQKYPGIFKENIKPLVDRYQFPQGHSVIVLAEGNCFNLGCANGNPSFVMSNSFTNQVLAMIELWTSRNETKYEKGKVYNLPKELDEMVARLHLHALDAELTELTQEQADYINCQVNGPYKSLAYRY